MKKAQVSIEFVIVIGIVLTMAFIFANQIFNTTDSIKAITKIKLKTLDLITANDSKALLVNIQHTETRDELNIKLYLKNVLSLNLSDQNYSDVILNIKDTTNYKRVNLEFENI